MAEYEILPKTGQLKKSDIMQTLNANGGVTDDDFNSFFKKTANHNIWSFRKPYAHPAMFRLTDAEIRRINCGLSIPSFNSMDAVEKAIDGGMNGWEYELPSGSTDEPFRINDFRGYDTKAKPPFSSFYIPSRVSNQSGTIITASFTYNPITEDGSSLTLSDLGSLADCYLGVKMYNQTTGRSIWNTMTSTLAENQAKEVQLSVAGLPVSNGWVAFPFICSAKQPQGAALQSAVYYSIPMVGKATLDIVSNLDDLQVVARYVYYEGSNLIQKVQFKFSYTNVSGGSTSNNYVYLTEEGGENPNANLSGEYMIKLPDFSVNVGKTYNYPYDYNGNEWAEISSLNFDANVVNWLSISIGSGRFVKSANLIQLVPQ